ncbi:MAG: isochorismatase family protein [Telmatospirillum sp.]|nr:isochorismatase family protein [Telmatospirillum sp.]
MTSALLIIDFQQTVFDLPAAYQADEILGRIAMLIRKARAAAAEVIYVQHGEEDGPWRKGSVGWQFPAAIAPVPGDLVSPKSRCDAFEGTGLWQHLHDRRIGRLVVCGYATEFCVDTNVRRAATMGLDTVVVTDAHTTRDRPHLPAAAINRHHQWIWENFGGITLCPGDAVRFD